jgi:hypothetical protein
MRTLRLSLAAVMAVGLGTAFSGCNEVEDASRVVVDIVNLNDNQPLLSDVYSTNNTPIEPNDDFIPLELVRVTFRARPHDDVNTLSPLGPYGSVRFLKYKVEFQDGKHANGADLDGNGSVDLTNFEAGMNAVVNVYSESTAFLVLISSAAKIVQPIVSLLGGGEFTTNAHITFYGQEETSGDSVIIERDLPIRIADYGDE